MRCRLEAIQSVSGWHVVIMSWLVSIRRFDKKMYEGWSLVVMVQRQSGDMGAMHGDFWFRVAIVAGIFGRALSIGGSVFRRWMQLGGCS